jgi:hypothetical protein
VAIRSPAYCSIDRTDPKSWHDYSDCPTGQQIKPENKRFGKPADYTRCGHCKNMD